MPDVELTCPRDGTSSVDGTPSLGLALSQRYEIVCELGRGASGVVYKAKQRYLDKVFAIKMLLLEKLSPDQIARFHQEAVALSKLRYPNLISLVDFGVTEDNVPYMVMDFIDGVTLKDLIRKERFLSPSLVVDVTVQLARAMSYAHRQGVLHRDLKPGNVMIVYPQSRTNMTAYILDFGIAKLTEDKQIDSSLTKTGEIFGSPLYMSPEQAQGKRVDERTDVYSLGCIMFEALSGRPPFRGENPLDVMMKKMQDAAPDLAKLEDRKIPGALSSIVSIALQRDPDRRFRNMVALEHALTRWRSTGIGVLIWDRKVSFGPLGWTLIALGLLLAFGSIGYTTYLICASQQEKKMEAPVLQAKVPPAAAPQHIEEADMTVADMIRNETNDNLMLSSRTVSDSDLQGLSKKYGLRRLMLGGVRDVPLDITDKAIDYFYQLPIRDLSIHYAPRITDEGMKKIATMRHLTCLRLRNMNLSDRGVSYLRPLGARLTALNVGSDQTIGDGSASTIASFSKLMDLSVDGTKFSIVGLKELTALKDLVSLDISFLSIDPVKLTFLSQMPNLEELTVRGDSMTDASIDIFKRLPKLVMLDISGNSKLSDEALEKLAELPNLRSLTVFRCRFSAAAVERLKNQRPDIDLHDWQDAPLSFDKLGWEHLDPDQSKKQINSP